MIETNIRRAPLQDNTNTVTSMYQKNTHQDAKRSSQYYRKDDVKSVNKENTLRDQPKKQQSSSSSRNPTSSSSSQHSKYANAEETITIEEIRRHPDGSKSVHRYIRGKMLGKGGFAKVYWCKSLDTQKAYAVKIVPKANLVKSRARQKLQAEIKIHRVLKQIRICDFKHFFEDRTNCYILLDLCGNQTMNEMIKRRKRLTEVEVMYFMTQLVEGVEYLHSCNIIHRDLKLGNLFLDDNMGIQIGDFGLAVKLSNSGDKRTTICGTPNYIAPEVIDCLKGGKRGHSFEVDIWAMGVIMYATLVGKPPYEAKDVKSTYHRILNNEFSFPSKLPISETAKDLVMQMLQSNPASRPTISQVKKHPFFYSTKGNIPQGLPSRCTRIAPVWHIDANGTYVPEFPEIDSENRIMQQKTISKQETKPSKHIRQPLGSLDVNLREETTAKTQSAKSASYASQRSSLQARRSRRERSNSNAGEGSRIPPMEQHKSTAKSSSSSKFKIFNDEDTNDQVDSREPQHQHRQAMPQCTGVDELTKRTSSFNISGKPSRTHFNSDALSRVPENESLRSGNRQPQENPSTAFRRVEQVVSNACRANTADVVDDMQDAVENMRDRLATTFNRVAKGEDVEEEVDAGFATDETSLEQHGAPVWVTRYVDYTSKYGLGFLLSDGSAGVYFNDSTKAVLSSDGNFFQYIERRKSGADAVAGDNEPTIHIFSISNYPEHLQKKVTLLLHFRDYLHDQEKKSVDGKPKLQASAHKCSEIECSTNSVSPYIYLKKWVRTKHAILFRLSNCTVQVIFFDKTEVLLSSEARVVTFVEKSGERKLYPLTEVTKNPSGEIAKRLKYSKDILQQLISGSKR